MWWPPRADGKPKLDYETLDEMVSNLPEFRFLPDVRWLLRQVSRLKLAARARLAKVVRELAAVLKKSRLLPLDEVRAIVDVGRGSCRRSNPSPHGHHVARRPGARRSLPALVSALLRYSELSKSLA